MSQPRLPDINQLAELMNIFQNQTPSAPAWFQIIDQVVSTLLLAEMARAEMRAHPLSSEPGDFTDPFQHQRSSRHS